MARHPTSAWQRRPPSAAGAWYCPSRLRSAPPPALSFCGGARRLELPRVAGPERVDRVGDPDVRRVLPQIAGDLDQAAGVAGEDRVGPRVENVAGLALAKALGHFRLRQVVAPRRP